MLSLARLAMRTRFEIVLTLDRDVADLRAAGEEALSEIQRVESQLSAFESTSDLYQINAYAALRTVKVDARVFKFLQQALQLSEQTDGAFDMSAGALAKCWNLAGMSGDAESAWHVPTDTEIAEALSRCGMMRQVILNAEDGTVKLARAGVRLDPGAIGKGYALERAANLLRESGIISALLHGGTSSVVAIGKPKDQDAWKVAVRDPLKPDAILATAQLKDTSLSVSAVHGKSFTLNGKRYGHVLDPRSGIPVHETVLAAVVHPSGTVSDAVSTALLVLGNQGAQKLEQTFAGSSFLIAEEDGRVNVLGTAFTNSPAERLALRPQG